jgi:hypothetical protein
MRSFVSLLPLLHEEGDHEDVASRTSDQEREGIMNIDQNRRDITFSFSDSTDIVEISRRLTEVIESSWNRTEPIEMEAGECVDLMIDILRLPGEHATDHDCLEMISSLLDAYRANGRDIR